MPSSSFRRNYGQLPAHSYTGWNNLGDVHRTLLELEFGRFRMAAIMVDQMMRDDRFSAVLDTRIDATDSVPFVIKPGNDTAQAQAIADDLGGIQDQLSGTWGMQFPAPVLGELRQWGIMLGLGVAEIIWDPFSPVRDGLAEGTKAIGTLARGKKWTPRLKIWHPQWVRWDWGTWCYKIQTTDGEVDLPRIDENPHGDGKWLLWCPNGYHHAWMKGAVRSLAVSVLERGLNRRNWGRFNEKFGLPIDVLKAPASAPTDVKSATFDMIANRGGETAIMLEGTKADDDDEAPGEQWEFDIAEVKGGAAWQTFETRQQMLNTDMAVKLLGQNLTTEVPKGTGSRAAVEGHDDIRLEKLAKDASLAPTVKDQVLHHDAVINYNDPTLAPNPYWQTSPPDDLQAKATTLNALGGALVQLQTAGAPVDQREVMETFEVPALTPEEEAAKKALDAEQAAEALVAAQQRMGGGGPPKKTAPDPADGGTKKVADDDPSIRAGAAGPLPGTSRVARRYEFAGLRIAVENPIGSTRAWTDHDGTVGHTVMSNDYGFIEGLVGDARRVIGNDKDDLDVYIGPDKDAAMVYNVHQYAAPDYKRYDEDKVFVGFSSEADARAALLAHRNDKEAAAKFPMSSLPLDVFKKKLKTRTGTGKIRAAAAPGATALQLTATTAALQALATRAHNAVQAAAKSKKPKDLKTADRLVRAATLMGSRALAPYLAALKLEIKQASSPADLERRLLIAFRNQDPAKFAEVMKRTRILGHLSGDLSLINQVAA